MESPSVTSICSFLSRGVSLVLLIGASLIEARADVLLARRALTQPQQQFTPPNDHSYHLENFIARGRPNFSYKKSPVLHARQSQTGDLPPDLGLPGIVPIAPRLPAPGNCKVIPGDLDWPENAVWASLMESTGHRLIKTIPAAAFCHISSGFFQPQQCMRIMNSWSDSTFHADDPTSVMWPYFQGSTCLPGYDANAPCRNGGYPEYVVNATTPAHAQAAVNFARTNRVRLVIKNTGHDFAGKSSGAGALSIWTHYMKNITFIPKYNANGYSGPAFKAGSGVQAIELYAAAKQQNVTVVGGEGETVGITGGYMAAGGHSPLSSFYGMGADQALAFEVVRPDGEFVTATADTNPDLFWALRGGGGSTFGVVTSVTIKAYPQLPVTVSTWSFGTGPDISADTFWKGIRTYMDYFIAFADAGTYAYFTMGSFPDMSASNMSSLNASSFNASSGPPPSSNASTYSFNMAPFFAPNMTVAQYNNLTGPFFARLRALGINIKQTPTYFDNFYDGWRYGFPKESVGTSTGVTGSRLFPRFNFQNTTLLDVTFDSIKKSIVTGGMLIAFNFKNEAPAGVDNAINPAWRTSVFHAITGRQWAPNASKDEIKKVWAEVTNGTVEEWRKLTPGSGAYMNEADAMEPDFQKAFFGNKYDRLKQIKDQLDPQSVFYAPTAVGSDDWYIVSESGLQAVQDGRLCSRTRNATQDTSNIDKEDDDKA